VYIIFNDLILVVLYGWIYLGGHDAVRCIMSGSIDGATVDG